MLLILLLFCFAFSCLAVTLNKKINQYNEIASNVLYFLLLSLFALFYAFSLRIAACVVFIEKFCVRFSGRFLFLLLWIKGVAKKNMFNANNI